MSPFLPVTVRNDWGRLHYSHGDTPTTFADGEPVHVRFPDGHTEAVQVRAVTYNDSVSDMGHLDHFTTTRYEAAISYHGLDLLVPLHKLEVSR